MSQGVSAADRSMNPGHEFESVESAGQGLELDAETDRAAVRAFASIYPDVNPAVALGLSTSERLGLAVATGVLAYGGAMGDLILTAAGLILVLFSVIAAGMKTPRRIRNEVRNRFPQQDWAEYKSKNKPWILGCWAIIIAIVALALFLVPDDQKIIGAVAAAVIAAGLMWSCPGIAPARAKRRRKKSDSNDDLDDAAESSELDDDTRFLDGFVENES